MYLGSKIVLREMSLLRDLMHKAVSCKYRAMQHPELALRMSAAYLPLSQPLEGAFPVCWLIVLHSTLKRVRRIPLVGLVLQMNLNFLHIES